MDWQPIETAPKDGTVVLLVGGQTLEAPLKSRPVTGFWDADADFEPFDHPDDDFRDTTPWAYAFWDGAWRSYYDRPTHWMPLPAPPPA